jgi:hypothetical protein
MPLTPLMHLTLPDLSDHSVAAHFAPIVLLLEGPIKVNEHHIRLQNGKFLRGEAPIPFPPLYASGAYYEEDPYGREDWRDVYSCLEKLASGHGVDCVPLSSLVLRDDYELVPFGDLKPGDRIMGDGVWTRVLDTMNTGAKALLAFRLSNGCTLRCTPEHRIFRDVDGRVEEIRAHEARVGDDLVTPASVPLAESEARIGWPEPLAQLSPEDRAWFLGVFVADGWLVYKGEDPTYTSCSSIAGRDGKPKEEQKRRVERLMKSIGIHTGWDFKSIHVHNREIAKFLTACGRRAPNKRMPSLAFASSEGVHAAIEGLAADAGRAETGNEDSTLVHGTTSPMLAVQLRVLYRMLGISTSIKRVDDHGGLGENAIYRVIPRTKSGPQGAERRDRKFARIREIADGGIEECGDITTDTGKFWMPESDVLVHNCDNLICWRVAELRVAGIAAEPVIKWQHLPCELATALGYPAPDEGLWLVHCCVRFPDGTIEDTSKNLGMGAEFTNKA